MHFNLISDGGVREAGLDNKQKRFACLILLQLGRQVAQSVEHQTVEVEVPDSKLSLTPNFPEWDQYSKQKKNTKKNYRQCSTFSR